MTLIFLCLVSESCVCLFPAMTAKSLQSTRTAPALTADITYTLSGATGDAPLAYCLQGAAGTGQLAVFQDKD